MALDLANGMWHIDLNITDDTIKNKWSHCCYIWCSCVQIVMRNPYK